MSKKLQIKFKQKKISNSSLTNQKIEVFVGFKKDLLRK